MDDSAAAGPGFILTLSVILTFSVILSEGPALSLPLASKGLEGKDLLFPSTEGSRYSCNEADSSLRSE